MTPLGYWTIRRYRPRSQTMRSARAVAKMGMAESPGTQSAVGGEFLYETVKKHDRVLPGIGCV